MAKGVEMCLGAGVEQGSHLRLLEGCMQYTTNVDRGPVNAAPLSVTGERDEPFTGG